MNHFISTEINKHLSLKNQTPSIPIHAINSSKITSWLSTLTKKQKNWVEANNFKANKDEILKFSSDEGNLTSIMLGLGDSNKTTIDRYASLAKSLPQGRYHLVDEDNLKLAAIGWALSQYNFDYYQKEKNQNNAILVIENEHLLNELSSLVNGTFLVRDLVNTPTCDMGPSHLSEVMKTLASTYDANFTEIVGDDLLTKNFNTIHAVGRAAQNQPRLLDVTWGRKNAPKVTLVGKGVCFDTGGLDIKPSSGMRFMKKDMGGAAHTLGIAQMIMANNLDVRLRLLIPAVENNISADAFRPGDIIKTYKGTTVEIDNTDAEGRLVLCDALALASEETPDLLINFATLTGAARVAMGTDVVPFFTDNDEIANDLSDCSKNEDDPLWRMPLHSAYATQLKSTVADLRNCVPGPFGGAITAGLFLKHFVTDANNWVHFDMYAWNLSNKATCPEGGEAMAIRAVYSYLQNRFQD